MINDPIRLTILGEPMAKQSCRFTRKGIKYQPKEIINNSKSIKAQIISQLPIGFTPFDDAIEIIYKFFYPFTAQLINKKSNQKLIEDGIIFYKKSKPDLDNLQKQINDAMNSIVFIDDARIVKATVEKLYAKVPRIEIEVKIIDSAMHIYGM